MIRWNSISSKQAATRRAFTLIEMLVAVTLVLLMMTLFASIFQMATESVNKQRVIAQSDQLMRQLTTVLRADISKRSMRNSMPFLPRETSTTSFKSFGDRTGYVYISCNDPASGQDDLLQFSADVRQLSTSSDLTPFYGAASTLLDPIVASPDSRLQYSPNQPEADDGDMDPNGAASSEVAEISYFLRGNSLIRRVMLARQPLPVAGEDLTIQPKSGEGNDFFPIGTNAFFLTGKTGAQTDFWRFFDFSAVPANMSNTPSGVSFVGFDALNNDTPTGPAFGRPNFRFGFNPLTGISREHTVAGSGAWFMGRYLQAETSADFASNGEDFNWPLGASTLGNGNPLDITNPVTLDPNSYLVQQFDGPFGRGGVRRVEDVLLTNVREFRVELWDSKIERWVVPGHSFIKRYPTGGGVAPVRGDYHVTRNFQRDVATGFPTYGPLQIPSTFATEPHVFDTWHPFITRDFDGDSVDDIAEHQPPFVPLKYYPPRQDATPPGPSPVAMPDPGMEFDPHPLAYRTGTNRGIWSSNQGYAVGDVVFATKSTSNPGTWDVDGDGLFDWNKDLNPAPPLTPFFVPSRSLHVAYRCVGTTTGASTGTSASAPPAWLAPGLRFPDGDLIWEGFDNSNPLRSIRITIRFVEPFSETPKQLSLILPLTDEAK